jgi:hypothetical protein
MEDNGPKLALTGAVDVTEGILFIIVEALAAGQGRSLQLRAVPMIYLRRTLASASAACLLLEAVVGATPAALLQKNDKDADARRPKLTLKAQPVIAMSPARIVLTAELVGGPNDYEEYYCPTIEWDWGDGTQSESTNDCTPYEPGKSEIKRRFTKEHIFRAGMFRVSFKLKQRDKAVAFASVNVQVRPGLRDTGQ